MCVCVFGRKMKITIDIDSSDREAFNAVIIINVEKKWKCLKRIYWKCQHKKLQPIAKAPTTIKEWSFVQTAINKFKQAYAICLLSKLVLWYLFVMFARKQEMYKIIWIFAMCAVYACIYVRNCNACCLDSIVLLLLLICFKLMILWWWMFDCYYNSRITFNRIWKPLFAAFTSI